MDGSPHSGSLNATTLWHIDAVEWAPSTVSFATDAFSTRANQCPLLLQ
jgi:hypothetical protein